MTISQHLIEVPQSERFKSWESDPGIHPLPSSVELAESEDGCSKSELKQDVMANFARSSKRSGDEFLVDIADHFLLSVEMLKAKMSNPDAYLRYMAKKWTKFVMNGRDSFAPIIDLARIHFKKRKAIPLDQEHFDSYTIRKAYRHAFRALHNNKFPRGGVMFSLDPRKSLLKERLHFLTKIDENDVFHLINWSGGDLAKEDDRVLGSGFCGYVEKVYDLANAVFAAMKSVPLEGDEEQNEFSAASLLKEASLLKKIHEDKLLKGVQTPPTVIFDISFEDFSYTQKYISLVGKLYNRRDLFDICRCSNSPFSHLPDNESIRSMVQEAGSGLEKIHETVFHGDIKPENIFLDYDEEEKKWACFIADFGGAVDFKNLDLTVPLEKSLFGTLVTTPYYTKQDYELTKRAVENEDRELWIDLQKMRDCFAFYSAIWELCTKREPYKVLSINKKNYRTIERRYKSEQFSVATSFPLTYLGLAKGACRQVKEVLGERAGELIIKGLSENPFDRPSLSEFLASFS